MRQLAFSKSTTPNIRKDPPYWGARGLDPGRERLGSQAALARLGKRFLLLVENRQQSDDFNVEPN